MEGTNLIYDDADQEPELHARTYVAVAAMFMLNLVQVFALQGPPAVVCRCDVPSPLMWAMTDSSSPLSSPSLVRI